VIRLGLRLTLGGGREAAVRLALIAAAVAVGVGLLLVALAGINAVNTQNGRYAWILTNLSLTPSTEATGGATHSVDPLWWRVRADSYNGQTIGRVDVAVTGPGSPVPPGIGHLPGPGQYYASPALTQLLRSTPAAQLGDRFPGQQIGTIGKAALPAPNSLIIIIGHTPGQMSHLPGAKPVTHIHTVPPSSCNGPDCAIGVGMNANAIDLVMSVIVLALLVPIVVFIGAATRLSAARREQRFAAMRLVGATPRQVSVISAVESTVAAAIGVAAGFGVFFLLRTPLAAIPFTGAPFFPSDLSLGLADVLIVVIGIPIVAAVAALVALRRVQISPLGVGRRVTPRPPRAWRLLPLVVGFAELGWVLAVGVPKNSRGQIEEFLPGFLLVMIGLVAAGPWLTMAVARFMARRTHRPATLIAARRLADNPRAGFRAVSGLVLALFVMSAAVGAITGFTANRGASVISPAARDVLTARFSGSGQPGAVAAPMPDGVVASLMTIRGVRSTAVIHTSPVGRQVLVHLNNQTLTVPAGLVSCAQLASTPGLGRCAANAQVAAFPADPTVLALTSGATTVWPTAAISPQRLETLPADALAVATNGSAATIERARTTIEVAVPALDGSSVSTLGEWNAQSQQEITEMQQLATVIIFISLPIAGCTLAVSVAGGLAERKRPFSLLRLIGAPLDVLRRVVGLEGAVPLVVTAVVASAAGFGAAALFLRAQLGYALRPPGPEYYGMMLAGLAASLAILSSTLPILTRITGPETARSE
jgi:hypothetical protein